MNVRPVDLARLGAGLTALAAPGLLLRQTTHRGHTGSDGDTAARRTVQVLGARYVIQSGVGLVARQRWIPAADATVDLVHAASMLGLATVAPRYRRLALVSAAAATGFAVADLREAPR